MLVYLRGWLQTSVSSPNTTARCLSALVPPLETLLVSDKNYKIHMAESKPKGRWDLI